MLKYIWYVDTVVLKLLQKHKRTCPSPAWGVWAGILQPGLEGCPMLTPEGDDLGMGTGPRHRA